jgi:hypothetical protein
MKSVKPILAVLLFLGNVYGQGQQNIIRLEPGTRDAILAQLGFQVLPEVTDPEPPGPHSIKIGTLRYGGTNSSGDSAYFVALNTTGITTKPLSFGNVILHVNGGTQATGPITTGPQTDILFVGGPPPFTGIPSCVSDCFVIGVQLLSPDGNPMTMTLVSGENFTTYADNNSFVVPKAGQTALDPQCDVFGFCKGASAPVVLRAVPTK